MGELFYRPQRSVIPYLSSLTVLTMCTSVTRDYDELREGNRVVSLGEKPYFDPRSKSRREALGLKKRIFGFREVQ